MSSPITAVVNQDSNLQSIRDMVATKDDGIPFLLLPVRIETRFMLADRQTGGNTRLTGLLEDLHIVKDRFRFNPYGKHPDQVINYLGKLIQDLDPIAQKADEIPSLDRQYMDTLIAKRMNFEQLGQQFLLRLGGLQWTDEKYVGQLRTLRQSLQSSLKKTFDSIDNTAAVKATRYTETTQLLGQLDDIEDSFASIKGKDLSTKDRLAKRQVFSYVEDKFARVEAAIKNVQLGSKINLQGTSAQILKLKSQIDFVKKEQAELGKHLTTINSDYKVAEFSARLSDVDGRLTKLGENLEREVLPKLELMKDISTTDAVTVLNEIHALEDHLAKINGQAFREYKTVKSTRVKLYDRMHKIRELVHRVIEGGEAELASLRAAWSRVDSKLDVYLEKVAKVDPTDRYEKAGLTRTATHINEEYRKDLGALLPGADRRVSVLKNKDIENSIQAYNEAISEMERLNSSLDQSSGDDRKRVLAEMDAFSQKFSANKQNLMILPAAKYQQMESLSQGLLSKVTSQSDPETAFRAGQSILSNVQAQYTDAQDRKDRFYDEDRVNVVLSPVTVTQKELWVRIFPDDVAIHSHEEALTQQEVDAGQAYWYEIWAAGSDEGLKLGAWRALVSGHGPERAAWIVKQLDPANVPSSSTSSSSSSSTIDPSTVFGKLSADLLDANRELADLNKVLEQGIQDNTNAFRIMEAAMPKLQKVNDLLAGTSRDNEILLLKTKEQLTLAQARLGQYLSAIQNLSPELKTRLNAEMTLTQAVVQEFGNVVESYSGIRAVAAAELVKDEININLSSIPVFPSVTIKDSNWTSAPHSKVMPNRFVVLAARGGTWRYIEVGKQIPSELIVGLDPQTFDSEPFSYDGDGNLIVDPQIKWLTDFETAEQIGMALAFEIDDLDWDNGFDELYVLGVKDTTKLEGKALLEQLMDNHHFLPEGASFLPIGTPTNNTETATSGYQSYDDDADKSFFVERRNESGMGLVNNPAYPTDAERLSAALGLEHSVFAHLAEFDRTEVSDALNFNRALFYGTMGEFMEEALDKLFTLDNINRTRDFVSNFVSARGYLPSLRIGTQPYGILPTTAFSRFSWTADDNALPQLVKQDFDHMGLIENELEDRFNARLLSLLRNMDLLWTFFGRPHVKYSENVGTGDPQAHFMEMLGLHANSVEHFFYYGLNVAARQNSGQPGAFEVGFDPGDYFSPTSAANFFKEIVKTGYYFKSDYFRDQQGEYSNVQDQQQDMYNRIIQQFVQARIYALRNLDDTKQLIGQRIDHRKLSEKLYTPSQLGVGSPEENYLAKGELENYIDFLLESNPYKIQANNKFSQFVNGGITQGLPSKSLLFMLLRHSVLSASADTILKVLEYEELLSQSKRKRIGQVKHYYARYGGEMSYVSKWTYLFSKIHSLRYVLGNNMDEANPFYSYMDQGSGKYLNKYISPEDPAVFNNSPRKAQHQHLIDELEETKQAIGRLKTIPTARLDRLLSEHLDLCSYRLDAWLLGLVNKRLDLQRQQQQEGIYVGAFGWVEKLERGGARDLASNIPEGLWNSTDGPVYTDDDNQGYIHAPSLNHAITAAVLRAGYESREHSVDIKNELAVNLSSARVRMGLNLLHGIRNGQEVGALLGYQFERGLHEGYLHVPLELDQYIYDFREEFPLRPQVDPAVNLGSEVKNNVVNGQELLEFAQDFLEIPTVSFNPEDTLYEALKANEAAFWANLGNANLSAAPAAKRDAMLKEIDRMADAFDALGDLCISESVYQVVQGNHIRAGAIFEKLSRGDVPDEITVADTPRTGTVVTQKVGMLIDPVTGIDHELTPSGPTTSPISDAALDTAVATANAAPAGWTSRFTARAILEPTLNKWVGERIGDPANIKLLAEYDIEGAITAVTISLADLEVQPLDVLHLFGTGPLNGGAELNTMAAVHVRSLIPSLPPSFEGTTDDVEVTLKFTERDAGWAATDLSFYEVAGMIQSLREWMTSSSIMAADHLHIPGEEEVPEDQIRNQDLDELMLRVSNALARLAEVGAGFDAIFPTDIDPADYSNHTFTNAQIDSLRAVLDYAAEFGVAGSRTEMAVSYGDGPGRQLTAAAIGAFTAVQDRLTRAQVEMAIAEDSSRSKDARVDALIEVAKIIMGSAYRVFPHFTMRNGADLSAQLTLPPNKGLMRTADAFAMEAWTSSVGRVRDKMAAWDLAQMHLDAVGNGISDPQPMQLPFELDSSGDSKDHWMGLEFPNGYEPSEDKMSLVLYGSDEIIAGPAQPKVGVLMDEWVEIIPNREETTGLAFHYDQPDAMAPNSILMAVTPKITGNWDWDNLVITLRDTLNLAKNRAVEPEHLENTFVGQILPGIMYEVVPPSGGEVEPQANVSALGWQVVTNFKPNNED